MGARIQEILRLCYGGKAEIVHKNINLIGRNTAQNGYQHEKLSEAACFLCK